MENGICLDYGVVWDNLHSLSQRQQGFLLLFQIDLSRALFKESQSLGKAFFSRLVLLFALCSRSKLRYAWPRIPLALISFATSIGFLK